MSDLTNPHDKFFKDVFTRQEAAQDFLQHYLPAEVAALLDLPTLEIGKDSFIDPDLQEYFSDLLYKVALHNGQETYIYVLFEHKSYPDPLIAFQLLKYMVRIWEQALKQEETLLPIFPLVVYHGAKRWTVALELLALFEIPDELKSFVPNYRYWLCDLSQYTDEEIKQAITLRAQLLVLKYILREGFGQRFVEMIELLRRLREQERGVEQVYTLLKYVARATDQVKPKDFIEVVEAIFADTGEDPMPTIVEQWLEQGREEGREEGQREATLTLLRRYLATRFGVPVDHFDPALQPLDLPTLTDLSEAAFEADNLTEFEKTLTAFTPPD